MSTELNAPAAIGRAVLDARRFDRSRVSLRAGVIAAIPVAGMLAIGTIIDEPAWGVSAGAGAMLGGVAWRAQGPDDPPIGTMAVSAIGLGIATVAGSASGRYPWLHLALLVVLCGCAGLLVSLGRRGSVPGTQAIIAYVVFGRFPQPLDSALGLAALVVTGGAAQAMFATLVGAPPAWRQQRQALAAAYRQLAALAARPGSKSDGAAAAFDAAEAKLTAPTLLGDPALMILSSLVEEGRRIRFELIALRTVTATLDDAARLSGRASAVLAALADAVVEPGERSQARLREALASFDAGTGSSVDDGPAAERHLAALAGQLHAVARMTQGADRSGPWTWSRVPRPSRGSRRLLLQIQTDLRQLRANASLGSAAGRHAARLAVVAAVAEFLAQHAHLPRGYWAVVAAATVLRPEFGATFTRGAERMAGTVIGVVVATFIVVGLDPSGWGIVAVVGALACGTYAVFPASFAAGTALLTGVVVFLLHAVAPDSATIALDRGLDTVVGGSLGLLAYALWPTWSGGSASRVMATLVDAQRAYVLAVLDCIITGEPPSDARLRPLARRARMAWSNADATISLAQIEPPHRLGDPGMRAIAALAGLRRLVYAGHTLRLDAAATDAHTPHPAWAQFRDGLAGALGAVGTRLSDGTTARAAPLRALYGEAKDADPLDPAMLTALDEIVDATNTVAASIGLEATTPDAERGGEADAPG